MPWLNEREFCNNRLVSCIICLHPQGWKPRNEELLHTSGHDLKMEFLEKSWVRS